MKTRSFRVLLITLCLGLLFSAACGSDNGVGPDGDGGTGSDELPAGTPSPPIPSGPFADVPATSDTLTVVNALPTNFRPSVARLRGDWNKEVRACQYSWTILPGPCNSWWNWVAETETDSWNDELAPVTASYLGGTQVVTAPMAFSKLASGFPGSVRMLLVEDGGAVANPSAFRRDGSGRGAEYDYETRRTIQPEALTNPVYVRRDRYWVRQQLSSTVGEYLVLTGDTEASLESSYTAGTQTTETEEFGRSVSVSGGLSYGPLSANVSATLSESYSTSVTIIEETTETFIRTVRGSPGKQTRFITWSLVERYTFTDSDGDPFTDPSYEFSLDTLYRRGVATYLQATAFDGP